jgi:5'-3' exonuclease
VSDLHGNRLMLLDSASLYFRAFFGVKETILAPDGTPVNAVRGFLDMVATLVARRRPDRLVACWDEDWRPQFRVAAIPSYKAHRLADPVAGTEQTPDDLELQIPIIVEVLEALGIARLGGPGLADDVIGTLVTREVARVGTTRGAKRADVDVVTGDRDLFQLVDDAAGVRVLYTGKGVRNLEVIDQAALAHKYGIDSGGGYAVMAALRGDPSDGLPGVPGIGEKTAAALVTRYRDLDALRYAATDPASDLSPAVRRRLVEAAAYLDVAMTVVEVVRGADLPAPDDALPATPPDHDRLVEVASRWGLDSAVSRVVVAMSGRG